MKWYEFQSTQILGAPKLYSLMLCHNHCYNSWRKESNRILDSLDNTPLCNFTLEIIQYNLYPQVHCSSANPMMTCITAALNETGHPKNLCTYIQIQVLHQKSKAKITHPSYGIKISASIYSPWDYFYHPPVEEQKQTILHHVR